MRVLLPANSEIKRRKESGKVEKLPIVVCPKCHTSSEIVHVLTAQSNQNVIYTCPSCKYYIRNIETNKG